MPEKIEPILRALFGPSNPSDRHAEAREALRLAFLAARAEKIAHAKRDPAGAQWVAKDQDFAIDRTARPTDKRAAMDPLRQQLQTAIRAMAGALVDSANRLANSRVWGRLSATAAEFETIVAGDPQTLRQRLGDAYQLLLRLGRFLETDIRVQLDPKASDGPLDPDIHGLLTDLVRTAAPWLRGFPTVAAWDDAAGKALVRADLFQPAREFTRIARSKQAISERDAAEMELLSETADTRDFQGQKAGNRAVGSAKNLILAHAGVLATFLSHEDASGFAGQLTLVQRAAATLGDAEAQVKAFVATMQSDLAQALRALVMESRSLDLSTFEAAGRTATDQSAAKRRIKAHLPQLAVDGGEAAGLSIMALSREEIETRCRRVDAAETDDFARLVELAGLDTARNLRRADWSDVSFRNSDIRGFDFTAARLHNCDFTGAKIAGACFVQAELGAVLHHGRDNPREPARMTGIANLRVAADWAEYLASFADPQRWNQPAELHYPSHLPFGAIFSDLPGLPPEMVVVPEGTFLMGSPDGSGGDNGDQYEQGRYDDEGPRRRIAFGRPFAIGRFAVTVAEFRAFATGKKSPGKAGDSRQVGAGLKPAPTQERRGKTGDSRRAMQDDRHPVTDVSWEDAVAYCAWLNARLGLPPNTYRLPSEAEWEYCARAGTDGPFWWKGSISTDKANYDGNYTYGNSPKGEYRQRTLPIDSFEPNPWGLYQVHGNVWEWTQDCWNGSYAGAPSDGSAWTTGDCGRRVLRGGAWYLDPGNLRAADRDWDTPDDRDNDSGFRLGRTLTP